MLVNKKKRLAGFVQWLTFKLYLWSCGKIFMLLYLIFICIYRDWYLINIYPRIDPIYPILSFHTINQNSRKKDITTKRYQHAYYGKLELQLEMSPMTIKYSLLLHVFFPESFLLQNFITDNKSDKAIKGDMGSIMPVYSSWLHPYITNSIGTHKCSNM